MGRLSCPSFRDFLAEMKFKGWNISHIESSGFLRREFVIKGDMKALVIIEDMVKAHISRMAEA